MNIVVGGVYADRKGRQWCVDSTGGPALAPVLAFSHLDGNYRSRVFQHNGSYWKDSEGYGPCPFDLVKVISVPKATR
jgi:hypothetical protein